MHSLIVLLPFFTVECRLVTEHSSRDPADVIDIDYTRCRVRSPNVPNLNSSYRR